MKYKVLLQNQKNDEFSTDTIHSNILMTGEGISAAFQSLYSSVGVDVLGVVNVVEIDSKFWN